MFILSLAKDPAQDVHQLIGHIGGTPASTSVSSALPSSASTSTRKNSFPARLDLFDELSVTTQARGSKSLSAITMSTSSTTLMSSVGTIKAPLRKPSSPPSVSDAIIASSSAKNMMDRTPVNNKTSSLGILSAKQQRNSAIVLPDQHSASTSKPGLMHVHNPGAPVPPGSLPSIIPYSSSEFIGCVSLASTVPTIAGTGGASKLPAVPTPASPGGTVNGAVRRLFSQQQSSSVNTSTVARSSASGGGSLLGPQPAIYPSLLHLPGSSLSLQGASPYPVKLNIHMGPGGSVASKHQMSKQPDSLIMSAAKDKPLQSAAKTTTTKPNYLNVINTGSPLDYPVSSSEGGVVFGDVIEQPVHQIMKAPIMIFHEMGPTTQKPKKKSTYSDAVGKKNDTMGPVGTKASSALAAHATTTGGPMGSLPPPQQQTQLHPLNLAPGTRPVGDKVSGNSISSQSCLSLQLCSRF